MAVGESLVVDAKQVQQSGVEVVRVNSSVDWKNSMLVGRAVHHPSFDASTCHPRREAEVMVLSSGVIGHGVERSPAKLGGPDDKGAFEHATLLQVGEEPSNRLIDGLR